MTDEKKWREWTIESFDHPDGNGEDTRRIYGPNTERVKVIEYAAVEKLQSEVERVREETLNLRDHMRDDLREERDQLQAKLQAAETVAAAANDLVKNYEEAVKELRTDARRLAEALETVVAQFEDMQGSNDIRDHWHKTTHEALTPEIRERYLK